MAHTQTAGSRPRGRGFARLLALSVAVVLVVPVAAAAEPATSGHVDADAGASKQFDVSGPQRAGLAWLTDLDTQLENVIKTSLPIDDEGRVFVQGRELPADRGYLNAVSAGTGEVVWDAPAQDVYWGCGAVATDDGRVIVQMRPNSPNNPGNFNAKLVAYDAATGAPIGGGQEYDPPETDDEPRMRECPSRLVLVGDLVLVPFGGADSGVRAIDVSSTPWTQAWIYTAKTQADAQVHNGRVDQVVVNDAGDTVYYASVKDPTATPRQWWLSALDITDGSVRDRVDLPGVPQADHTNRIIAIDGGVAMSMPTCEAEGTGNATVCVVRVADDGTNLEIDWVATPTNPAGDRVGFASLTDTGQGVLAGWILGSGDIYGLDASTGAVVFRRKPSSFSNNGQQLIADSNGTLYNGAFGGDYLEAFTPTGADVFTLAACSTSSSTLELFEPGRLGGIAPDGTLVIGGAADQYANGVQGDRTYALVGIREGAPLPKGSCPEEETRVAGVNRVETSVEISGVSFPEQDSADTVVIATAENYPDALAGGPLARKLDAPLLLTFRHELHPSTKAEIERLGATNAVLLGGTSALSTAVEDALKAMGLTTDRIAGTNRFHTAGLIADRVPATTAYVTEGANPDPRRGWPDAVAVSGLASFEQRPILLVTRDAVPAETAAAMGRLAVTEAVVVGGEAAVSAATATALGDPDGDGTSQVTVTRESGPSRFATSVKIAERSVAAGASTLDLWFATGLSFPDALTAGPAVARSGGVLALVHGQDVAGGPEVYAWLETLDDDDVLRAWFVGGTAAISDAVAAKLAASAGIG
jgi:hypothetical protein